jgi:homoserine dehydrogenase
LQVANHPGTLAAITSVLASHKISIASVIQHESGQGKPQDPVPLVIMTHEATVGCARAATIEIEKLSAVTGPVVRLRVKD